MEKPSFVFTTPFNVNIVQVKGEEKVFMEGLISTTDKDLVNDIVTLNCLKSMQTQILERNMKLDVEHEAFRGGSIEEKEINKTIIPAGKIIDATIENLKNNRYGLRVKAELNLFGNNYEQVKGNVLNNYLDAYSIAFLATDVKDAEVKGEPVRLLNDVRLLNVALTGNPINTQAKNSEVFVKSMDALEEYKKEKKSNPGIEKELEVKHNHISGNKLNLKEVKNMTEDKLKAEAEAKLAQEVKDAEAEAEKEKEKEAKETEEKALKDAEEKAELTKEVKNLKEEVAELKALSLKAIPKSPVSNQDAKDKDFKDEAKSINPLDAIV